LHESVVKFGQVLLLRRQQQRSVEGRKQRFRVAAELLQNANGRLHSVSVDGKVNIFPLASFAALRTSRI